MSRSLPASITAALAATGAQPTLSVTSQDLQLRYSQLVSTGLTQIRNAALLSSGGSLIRASCTQGADPNTVKVYRIPSPSTAGNWSAAARATPSTNAMATAGVCLVQTGSAIRCFWVDATSKAPKYSESTDDGQTWGAQQVTRADTPSGATFCYGLMADSTTSVIGSYQVFAIAGFIWSSTTFSSGSWQAWSAALGPATTKLGNSYDQIRGLSLDSSLATRVIACGARMRAQQSGQAAAVTTWDGNVTFTSLNPLQEMDTPSNGLTCNWPTVHYNSGDSYYYAAVTIADDGSVSGNAQNRTNIMRSKDGLTWQLVGAAGTAFSYESHVFVISGVTYIFDNASVWTAPGPPGPTDLSADVLALSILERSKDWSLFTLTLANNNGQYLALANLRDNCALQIAIGLNGTTIATHTAYIDAVRHQAAGSILTCVIQARGLGKFLAQISPRLIPYTSSTVAAIATNLCAIANVPLASLPVTSQFSQTLTSFVLTPGESYDNALKRLSNVYDFDFFETGAPSVSIKIVERSAGDASAWTYGQEVLAASVQTDSDQANIIRVVGASTGGTNVFAEVTDQANIASTGAHRLRQIVDRIMATAAQCTLKGQLALRDEQTSATTVQLTVTLNPAHEIMDVITLTDDRIGLAAQSYRIHEIRTQIDFHSGMWVQHLTCHKP